MPQKVTDSGYHSPIPIRVTPQQHNTYTPPMAHAWGRSVMIGVCVGYQDLIRQLGEHVSVYA